MSAQGKDMQPSAMMKPTVLKLRHTGSPNVGGGQGALWGEDVSFTLATSQDQTLFQPVDFRHGTVAGEDGATGTLQAKSTGGHSLNYQPGATDGYVVRRLTPTECERLQAMPDGHTDITGCDVDAVTDRVAASLRYDDKQKAALRRKVERWSKCPPDGKRYKAIGNAMAVNVMRWIFERVQMVDEIIGEEGDER